MFLCECRVSKAVTKQEMEYPHSYPASSSWVLLPNNTIVPENQAAPSVLQPTWGQDGWQLLQRVPLPSNGTPRMGFTLTWSYVWSISSLVTAALRRIRHAPSCYIKSEQRWGEEECSEGAELAYWIKTLLKAKRQHVIIIAFVFCDYTVYFFTERPTALTLKLSINLDVRQFDHFRSYCQPYLQQALRYGLRYGLILVKSKERRSSRDKPQCEPRIQICQGVIIHNMRAWSRWYFQEKSHTWNMVKWIHASPFFLPILLVGQSDVLKPGSMVRS